MASSFGPQTLTVSGGTAVLVNSSKPGFFKFSFALPKSELPNGNWASASAAVTGFTYNYEGNSEAVASARFVVIDDGTANTNLIGGSIFQFVGYLQPIAPGDSTVVATSVTGLTLALRGYPPAEAQADPSVVHIQASSDATGYSCPGASATLGWSVIGTATSCTSKNSGSVAFNQNPTYDGTETYTSAFCQTTPDKSDAYTLTVVGLGGDTATSTWTITAVELSVSAQITQPQNGPPLLTWTSSGAGGIGISYQVGNGEGFNINWYSQEGGGALFPPPLFSQSTGTVWPLSGSLDISPFLFNDVSFSDLTFTVTASEKSYPVPSNLHNYPAGFPYYPCPSGGYQHLITRTATASLAPTSQGGGGQATVKAQVTSSVGSGAGGSGGSSRATGCLFLSRDAHRRPLAAASGAGTPATGYYSNDAGHSFASSVIDADITCADISLLVNRPTSRYYALYTKGKPGSEALYAALGPVVDGFPPDAVPAAVRGVSGVYPIACEHPTERGAALLLLVQGGSLVCAETGDGGETWAQAGTVASGVDFSASGRPGLCFLGETAFAAYASGKSIACAKSLDRGVNWKPCAAPAAAAPSSAGTSGPYSGLSLLGWQGTLYLLAFAAPSAGSSPVPTLFLSEELGDVWTVSTAPLPKIAVPSALGVLPETGRLRLGLGFQSEDNAASWLAA